MKIINDISSSFSPFLPYHSRPLFVYKKSEIERSKAKKPKSKSKAFNNPK